MQNYLHGGSCMSGCVVNLTSYLVLSLSRAVFSLCFAHPCTERGLAALCMRHISYPLFHPVSTPGTAYASPTLPVQHLWQCPSLAPCVSASQPCAGLEERGCSPAQLLQKMCLLMAFCTRMCPMAACFRQEVDLPLPTPM